MPFRRILCLLLPLCLIFTQTAQAYSLARLPYKYQRINIAAAGGTVAILAGQDTLSQQSSTLINGHPNAFTQQRRTITDTYNSIDSEGSTLAGNGVSRRRVGTSIVPALLGFSLWQTATFPKANWLKR